MSENSRNRPLVTSSFDFALDLSRVKSHFRVGGGFPDAALRRIPDFPGLSGSGGAAERMTRSVKPARHTMEAR